MVPFVAGCCHLLQVCCRCVAGVLQVCCRCVAGMLQMCCRCIAGVLQVCCRCDAGVLQVCCRCVEGVLQVCCRCVAGVLQVCCSVAYPIRRPRILISDCVFYECQTLNHKRYIVYSQHYLMPNPPFEEFDSGCKIFLYNAVFNNRVKGF